MGCGASSKFSVANALAAQEQQNRQVGTLLQAKSLQLEEETELEIVVTKPEVTDDFEYEHDIPVADWTFDGTWKAQVAEGRINFATVRGRDANFTGASYSVWSEIQVDKSKNPPTFNAKWHSLKFGSRGTFEGSFQGPKLASYKAYGGTTHSAVCLKLLDLDEVTERRMTSSGFYLDVAADEARAVMLAREDQNASTAVDKKVAPVGKRHPSEWGMSLRQIQHFRDYLQLKKVFVADDGRFRATPPNMYAICYEHISPLTKGTGLSLSCLYNQSKGKVANVFVSHSWAENFLAFVANLATGAGGSQRPLRRDDNAWICTFAINQNADIADELGESPDSSPFALVLRKALEVVVVFNDEVDLYDRIWCCYEMFLSLEWEKDVRSVGSPSGWTDVVNHIRRLPDSDSQRKKEAIKKFGDQRPVNISRAKASVQRDKEEIMAAIRTEGEDMFARINEKIKVLRHSAWVDLLLEMKQ